MAAKSYVRRAPLCLLVAIRPLIIGTRELIGSMMLQKNGYGIGIVLAQGAAITELCS